jgi:cytochrome c oxidase cbb3-type subunit 1
MSSAAVPVQGNLVNRAVIKHHLGFGFLFLLVSVVAGLLYSLQLTRLYPFPGIELMSPGRWRMVHTNAVAFGFLINVFIGVLYWVVPRLTGRPVLSEKLSWLICYAWQLVVLLTAGGILGGTAQAIEWGETPTWVDPIVVVGVALLVVNVSSPILKTGGRKLYVSLWYFSAMLVWLPLVYVMGNFIPQYFVPGAGGAAVTGLYIHDLVGLSVTPLGWGMMYYFVPLLLERPIWSHTLSIVGFWGLAFFYPLNGVHHFFYLAHPHVRAVRRRHLDDRRRARGVHGHRELLHDAPRPWRPPPHEPRRPLVLHGMVNYFITCLQCAFQTTLTFQKIIHFTDWVVGHAHLVMLGVFAFWLIGGPSTCGRASPDVSGGARSSTRGTSGSARSAS